MNKTIEFFYQISKIPRESGNEENISNYLCEFAKNRNLYFEKDKYNNVIIKKKTSNSSPIILQAHMDMVCEKENNIEFDFKRDSIEVIEENGYLKAKGTTLGADNGVGIAQILNILDSDIKCNIEAIFTVSEETTMIGAERIDLSKIKANRMINLDGFEDNTIVIGSASFYDIILKLNYDFDNINDGNLYKISLNGLLGGHSGFDINKDRGNSSIILAEILQEIEDISLVSFIGGNKFNVIPSTAECVFISKKDEKTINDILSNFISNKKKKYNNLEILIKKIESNYRSIQVLNNENSFKFIKSILEFRHGVFAKNNKNEVTTSINLGSVDIKSQIIKIGMRSSKKEEEKECLKYIKEYSNSNKYLFTILGSQPGFETDEDSELVKKIKQSYENINKKEKIKIKSIHITVEAGFFKDKINNLDVIIISPKILNAHTPKECVSIESIKKCDECLLDFLTHEYSDKC